MYTITYNRYNHISSNITYHLTKSFETLYEFQYWMFKKAEENGDYSYALCFVDPDDSFCHRKTGLYLDKTCISTKDKLNAYHIEMITKNKQPIYSEGTHTNGKMILDDEVKDWLEQCRYKREVYIKENPPQEEKSFIFEDKLCLQYLRNEFRTMENHFAYDMVANLLKYAKNTFTTKEELSEFLLSIIPEVTEEELEQFYLNPRQSISMS